MEIHMPQAIFQYRTSEMAVPFIAEMLAVQVLASELFLRPYIMYNSLEINLLLDGGR